MPPVQLMIKPASSLCNMKCDYCFYRDIAEKRSVGDHGIMSYDTCRKLIERTLDYASDSCSFIFQGGEPTLAGADFYRFFVNTVNKMNTRGLKISYSMQTNGYDLCDDMLTVLAQNDFLVGLSLDGNRTCHDAHRRDAGGNETFSRIVRSARRLTEKGIDFNILTVVTPAVAENIRRVFTFFLNQNYRFLQFIPCLSPLYEDDGEYAVTDEKYGDFLMELFDLWHEELMHGNVISIRYFDNLVSLIKTGRAEACGMSGCCSAHYVVESDGSVYPCDFYVTDGFCIGNLNEDSFPAIDKNRREIAFIENSANTVDDCRRCRYRLLCGGGCRRERRSDGSYRYCGATRKFLDYALPRLVMIAK